ncbi:DUF1289 domain-containing protein [Uliginosibacterium sp. H1]|uniref:DUF1289 domain-containing protein n=1 Tax=Uliginosibacterium sp. H1 TaxID=3114757 RepID=UPI002E183CD9|nr:DUF1289 domain-containing protein [Uliginosibacterium sp. H1]
MPRTACLPMTDPSPATVASPCIRHCCLDPDSDVCVGCFRTLDEITGWSQADDAQRAAVLQRCVARRADYQQRYPDWCPPIRPSVSRR